MSQIQLVIKGERNLSIDGIAGIARSMDMTKAEADNFQSLVLYNQCAGLEEKLALLRKLDRSRKTDAPRILSAEEARYLERWYNPVVREMAGLPGFDERPERVVASLAFPVSRKEVAESLRFLEVTGYLRRDGGGRLTKSEKTLRAVPGAEGDPLTLVMRAFHAAMLDRARSAVADLPRTERTVTDTVVSLSRAGYEAASQRIRQMRDELLALASADAGADRVYHLSTVLFPLTRPSRQDGVKTERK